MTDDETDTTEWGDVKEWVSQLNIDRRKFLQAFGVGTAGLSSLSGAAAGAQSSDGVIKLEAVTIDPDGQGGSEHVWKAAELSMAEAVAAENPPPEQIGMDDIQQAINWWATDAEVPDTGGETIGFDEIQQLINKWATDDTEGIDSINPTLSLTAGEEYTVELTNVDGDDHSFIVADADGNELASSSPLTQQGATQTFSFTATEEMAEYYCGTHPEAQGGVIEVDSESPIPVDKPNVIIIMADDMGYGDTSVEPFTSDELTPTPNLEDMAADGAKFTAQYNAAPVCTPTRGALLTGSYPKRNGVNGGVYFPGASKGLHPDETTIPEVVKQQGYATGMIGKWHLGDADPFLPPNQGFDTYFGVPYSNDMNPFPLLDGFETVQEEAPNSQLTQLYTERAKQFIQDNQDQPFFLYMPHTMPHVPLGVSSEFDGKTGGETYADVINELDWSVGQILDQLKSLGIEEDTLVIFTSDDGPWTSKPDDSAGTSGPLRDGKMSTYEGGARVPTIAHMPGTIPAGSTCDEMTSHIDFLPTVANLAGADLPDVTIDGKDITNVLVNPATASSPHDYIYYYDGNLEAIRNAEGYKYHFSGELYDLEQDIGESNNIASQNPGIVDQLEQQGNSFDSDLTANARPEGDLSNLASVSVGSTAQNGTTTVTFSNNRSGTATDVTLSASSPDDGVSVDLSSTSLGSVGSGSSAQAQATITVTDGDGTSEAFVRVEATYVADGEQRTTAAGEQVSVSTLDPVPDQYSTFNNGSQNPVFGSENGSLVIEGTGSVYKDSDTYSSIYLDDGLQSTGTVVTKVSSVDQATQYSTGDLMVRNDITKPGESPGYIIVSVNKVNAEIKIDENGDGSIQKEELTEFDEASGLPKWLRIQRDGTSYTASYSADGSNWTQIAAFTLEEASDVQDVGVAVTSNTEENLRAEFGEFQVSDTTDGNSLPEKYSTFNNGSSDPEYGALTEGFFIEGTGKAASDTDEYTAVYLDDELSENATAVAKINSVELVSTYSTGGFIVRNDVTGTGSSKGYAQIGVSENGGEVKFDEDANGFLDDGLSSFAVNGLPVWLKLERNGTSYTASSSADGSSWTEVATFTLENASSVQDIGIAVTAPADENTRVEVGEFEVTKPLPDKYSTFNNGSANPLFGYENGSLVIEGTGAVSGDKDAYSSIYLDDGLQSTGTVVTKVSSVDQATQYSTGDLIVRNDITKPGESPGYVIVSVNKVNAEIKIDENGDGNIQSSELSSFGGSGLPKWLRIQRNETNYTASYSSDGSNWTQIAAFTLEEASAVQDAGVAVTSSTDENARAEFGEFQVSDTGNIGGPLPDKYSTFNNGSSDPNYGSVDEDTLFIEGTGKAASDSDEYTAIYLDDSFSSGVTATVKVKDVEMVDQYSTADLVVRNDITGAGTSQGYASITVNENVQEVKVDADVSGKFESSEIEENSSPGLPVWLRWERSNTTFTASYSTDGSNWTQIKQFDLSSAASPQDVGVAVTGPEGNQRVEIGDLTVSDGN